VPIADMTSVRIGVSQTQSKRGREIQRLYKEAGVELEKYHGNQGYFLPMAAKLIVGRDGRVKARQVNIEFRERMEPQALIATLRQLRIG